MRINVRLDDNRSQKLDFLARATHLSTSEIVKQAIDLYYEQVMSASAFIGCGEAAPDLSDRYKEEVLSFVTAKHDHR